nr:major histocompatibility complex class I-related gene protein-like [Nerophis lumbriciformis]
MTVAKQDWMNKITAEQTDYWERETDINYGVHIVQKMTGCEWNDETGEVKGWYRLSYDGEDFISLDMKTWTWTASRQQAFPSKLKWDQDKLLLDYFKYYYTEECPSYLKKYVNYGKEVLMRTEVFLLQKTPSSPVSCMATGFYPDTADLFWRKDGEQIFEDVEHGEILPNPDGTFQMTVHLKVEVTSDVEENLSVTLAATAAVVAVLAVLAAIIIVMLRPPVRFTWMLRALEDREMSPSLKDVNTL